MKSHFIKMMSITLLSVIGTTGAFAQKINPRAIKGAVKTVQAVTLTDAQMAGYVKEYMDWMDEHNEHAPKNGEVSPYTERLNKLTGGLTEADGIKLNFKVYHVVDVNAFACPDGSIRVFSSLMDIMTDEELLGVIGHEIGHIAHRDSKNAFRNSLLTSALKDGIASSGDKAAALTDSQLGDLGEALMSATYSQKQEYAADDYGYVFLKEKGKNPWAMPLALQRLKTLQEEAGASKISKMSQLFSTHPDLDNRIKRMIEKAEKEGIERPTE